MTEFLGYFIPGLMLGTVYTVIALGFITIYRTTGVLNIAQGEYFLLGAYAVYLMIMQAGMPFWLGIPLAFVILGVAGLMTERFTLRPLVGQPWEYLFYIDFAGHTRHVPCARALDHLREMALFLRVLGSYPRHHWEPTSANPA